MKLPDRSPNFKHDPANTRFVVWRPVAICLAGLSLPASTFAQGAAPGGFDSPLGVAVPPVSIPFQQSQQSQTTRSNESAFNESILDEPQAPSHRVATQPSRYETPVRYESSNTSPGTSPDTHGQRPDFLPAPSPVRPAQAYPPASPASPASYTPPAPQTQAATLARPADAPQTIIAQVEIPLPPQTAEPLSASESMQTRTQQGGFDTPVYAQSHLYPAPAAQPTQSNQAAPTPTHVQNRYGEVIEFQDPTQSGQPVQMAQAVQPTPVYQQTQAPTYAPNPPAYSSQAPAAPTTPSAIPRQGTLNDPTLTTADIPPPQENVSPAIIYDDAQQGVPRAPAPEPGPDVSLMLKNRQYAEVEAIAIANNDTQLASALGWARYRDGNNQLAYDWFQQALQWNEGNNEAAYGMALTLFRMGRYDQAEQVARWRVEQYPRMKKVLADISSRRSVSRFRSRNYTGSSSDLATIRKHRPLTHEEQIVSAWNDYNSGKRAKARTEFIRLYRAKPDKYSAHGVYTVYAADRDWSGLEAFVRQYGGPLAELYDKRVAEKYSDLGLQRMAYRADPCRYPELQNISSPAVAVEVLGRTRSGTDGTSQLSEYGARIRGTVYSYDRHRIDVAVGVTHLDAGTLQGDTRYGTYPPDGTNRAYRYQPQTNYPELLDARIRWEHQGMLTPMIELGITPVNGEIDPTFVGSAGIRGTQTWGNWTAEIYRNSVKDSVLSYTGLRDPYTGRKWGRVTETGGRFSLFNQFQKDWGFYGAASVGVLTGHNVPDNSHAAFTVAVNKTLEYEGFDYIAIGPVVALDFYNRNLSQFTYGHGGYFSPEHLIQGALAGQFLTKQGRSSLLRGTVSLGVQTNRQEAAPLFPTEPDDRWYSSLTSSGVAINLDVEGMTMLSQNWALGGQIGVNVAPNYNDFSLRVSLQYFFEPRNGLFAQDFFRF